ncbi:hypothetical protein VTL71DRAFT_9657 [Oculimacula yallundae]|uniref:F-box domain-containing protein n=1 Tax=Oculimacula yallundae TaxID=86028 RepID=A0ABR4BRF8_9HELO
MLFNCVSTIKNLVFSTDVRRRKDPMVSMPDDNPQEGSATAVDSIVNRFLELTAKQDYLKGSSHVATPVVLPDESTTMMSRIHLLDLPIDLIELLIREYLDITSNTCLGLTCKALFPITEYHFPFSANLHMRTAGTCLGHLLTTWMAPKYAFSHSWGKFLLKRAYKDDSAEIERKWKQKESWKKIRVLPDTAGAQVAYESEVLLRVSFLLCRRSSFVGRIAAQQAGFSSNARSGDDSWGEKSDLDLGSVQGGSGTPLESTQRILAASNWSISLLSHPRLHYMINTFVRLSALLFLLYVMNAVW